MAEVVKETEVVKQTVLVNPFHHFGFVPVGINLGAHTELRVKTMEVDKETLVTRPVFEEVDIDAEIEACRDLCGMELMRRQLATGQAVLSDFADDGRHGVDLTNMPETIHEAARMANEANTQVQEVMTALGLKEGQVLSGDMVEELLKKKVQELWDAQMSAKAAADNGGDAQ